MPARFRGSVDRQQIPRLILNRRPPSRRKKNPEPVLRKVRLNFFIVTKPVPVQNALIFGARSRSTRPFRARFSFLRTFAHPRRVWRQLSFTSVQGSRCRYDSTTRNNRIHDRTGNNDMGWRADVRSGSDRSRSRRALAPQHSRFLRCFESDPEHRLGAVVEQRHLGRHRAGSELGGGHRHGPQHHARRERRGRRALHRGLPGVLERGEYQADGRHDANHAQRHAGDWYGGSPNPCRQDRGDRHRQRSAE